MAHLAFTLNNKARAFLHGLTGATFIIMRPRRWR